MKLFQRSVFLAFAAFFQWANGYPADSSIGFVMTVPDLQATAVGGQPLDIQISNNENQILNRTIVRNTGNMNEDFVLRIASTTGPLAPVSSVPADGQYRLYGIWYSSSQAPVDAAYGANDILTESTQTSSAFIFAKDSGPDSDKGFNVPPWPNIAGEKSLYFYVQGPPHGNSSTTVHVSVMAVAH